jgi:hypothetical protein
MRITAITAAVVLLTAACITTRPTPTNSPTNTTSTPIALIAAPRDPASPGTASPATTLAKDDPIAVGDASWLPANLRPVAPPGVDPLEAARLAENEFVTLPTRAAPIERWKAQRYFCLADFNRDDAIDEDDTRTFLEAFTTREGPFAEFLDLNREGVVDQSDMDVMLHAAESTCDPAQVARNRDVSC